MTTTTMYIFAFLGAYVLTLFTGAWIITANKRYQSSSVAKKEDLSRAVKDSNKALESTDDLQKQIDQIKLKQTGFEELLNSFTNRMSARSENRGKKLSKEEVLAQAFMEQSEKLNGEQSDIDFEQPPAKKKNKLVRMR